MSVCFVWLGVSVWISMNYDSLTHFTETSQLIIAALTAMIYRPQFKSEYVAAFLQPLSAHVCDSKGELSALELK